MSSPGSILITASTGVGGYSSCLIDNFYGTYNGGKSSIFIADDDCISSWSTLTSASSASIVPFSPQGEQTLVWVDQVSVEDSLKTLSFGQELDTLLERLSASVFSPTSQDVLAPAAQQPSVVHRAENSAIIAVSPDAARDMTRFLPPILRAMALPASPQAYLIPVPKDDVAHIKEIIKALKFDPEIASIVSNISIPQMQNDLRFLTGEDSSSGITSRHSFSSGARVAAKWLKSQFELTGATCELRPFSFGYAPNVICTYPAAKNVTNKVIVAAHYDSRGSFGSTRAPGANDDGSGSVALLSIAHTIARKGIQFQNAEVQLIAFAGEEQGLVGSRAYSRELRQLNANVTLMIQADMLAYRAAGEPAQLGLPDKIGTPEVATLVTKVAEIYTNLKVGFTPACCSDHQSFHEQGFAATHLYERAGPIADPMYHNSGDLSERDHFDLEQVKSIAQVEFATILHTVGYKLHK